MRTRRGAGALATYAPGPMTATIVPLAERYFAGLRRALDVVARERRYLAFTAAPPEDAAYAFYRDIVEHDHCHLVALVGDEVVGWCDVLPVRGEARAHAGVLGIGLVPWARHRGIGRALMQAALQKAQAKGFTRIELTVRADNDVARALYARLGFVVEGLHRRAFVVDGVPADSLAMALVVAPGQGDDADPAGAGSTRTAGIAYSVHDDVPDEQGRLVDTGLGVANEAAAPLHEVRPLACFARLPAGETVGGAVGRTWGECAEVQQLWVAPEHRRRGLATRLLRAFEHRARQRGCRIVYLETFSFQAPALYRALGYAVRLELRGYGEGIVKYTMVRELESSGDR